jgi:hypothetical protein
MMTPDSQFISVFQEFKAAIGVATLEIQRVNKQGLWPAKFSQPIKLKMRH